MFGYVNISRESLSKEDFLLYRSYYCGLCKAIGKKSQIFRLSLNNDLTFLSILLSGVSPDEPQILENRACIIHHIKKHNEIGYNRVLDYTADMNILLAYLKLADDAQDENGVSAKVTKKLLYPIVRDLIIKYEELYKKMSSELSRLFVLENEKCSSIDEVADCFAKLLEAVFEHFFDKDDENRKVMAWLGYNLGRWIYIIDAYNDIKKDTKKGSYNPFLYSNESIDKISKNTYEALTYTLSNIAAAYDLLKIYRNDSLIRNVLYHGLSSVQDNIFHKTEEQDESLWGFGS